MDAVEAANPVVDHDLICIGCGYNLRTLRWDSVCTECGRAVEDSAIGPDGASHRLGLPIWVETPLWLRWNGAACFAYLAGAAGMCWAITNDPLLEFPPYLWIHLAAYTLTTVAWCLITRRGTCAYGGRAWLRLAARIALCTSLVCSITIFAAIVFGLRRSAFISPAERVFYLTNSLGTILGFLWLRQTALRMRQRLLAVLCLGAVAVSLEMGYAYLCFGMRLPLPSFGWIFANQYIDLPMIGPVFTMQREYLRSSEHAFGMVAIGAAAIIWTGFAISFFVAGAKSARQRKARSKVIR
jgi:hypothetical protein